MLTPPLLEIDVLGPPSPSSKSAASTPASCDTNTSSTSSEGEQCYICMSSGASPPERLCGCTALAHQSCVERWIKTRESKRLVCEVCLQPYTFDVQIKPPAPNVCLIKLLPFISGFCYGISFPTFEPKDLSWAAWTGNTLIITFWLVALRAIRQPMFSQQFIMEDLCILFGSYTLFAVGWAIMCMSVLNWEVAFEQGWVAHACNTCILALVCCSRSVCVYCQPNNRV